MIKEGLLIGGEPLFTKGEPLFIKEGLSLAGEPLFVKGEPRFIIREGLVI